MGNAIVLALLRSPLGRLLGGLCELEFTGRRSDRAVRLPVQYARDADRVVVHVGHTAGKRWWRNFTDPHPVRVHARGATLVSIGRLVRAGDADRPETERVYRQRYPKATLSTHDSMVLIERVPARPLVPAATGRVPSRSVVAEWWPGIRCGGSSPSPTGWPGPAGCRCWPTGRTG